MRYDIAIIGGGPAGYTAAERAGANGLRAVCSIQGYIRIAELLVVFCLHIVSVQAAFCVRRSNSNSNSFPASFWFFISFFISHFSDHRFSKSYKCHNYSSLSSIWHEKIRW